MIPKTFIIIDKMHDAYQTGSGKHALKEGYNRTVISGNYYSDITFPLNWAERCDIDCQMS